MKITPYIVLSLLLCAIVGCQDNFEKSFHDVAKKWCLAIRASQIIPVYPPSQDIQVGDIFLVSQTVNDQHQQYVKDGFLPLPQHIGRLPLENFAEFYKYSFANSIDKSLVLPKEWFIANDSQICKLSPNVYFPGYSFDITENVAANMAIPVQGIPIGLSLLNSNNANCSIMIKNAKTYGLDFITLYDVIQKWGNDNHSLLVNYAAPLDNDSKKTNYIRVISRVYLAGEIAVSLSVSHTGAMGASAGSNKVVELLLPTDPQEKSAIEYYSDAISKLNNMISNSQNLQGGENILSGGKIQILAASENNISMNETFDKPVPIGYLAFDMCLDEYGFLGPPVSTKVVLKERKKPQKSQNVSLVNLKRAYDDVFRSANKGDSIAKRLIRSTSTVVKRFLPDKYPVNIYDDNLNCLFRKNELLGKSVALIPRFAIYLTRIQSSIKSLEKQSELDSGQQEDLKATINELCRAKIFIRNNQALLSKFMQYAYGLNDF